MSRDIQIPFDKRTVDRQLRLLCGQLLPSPMFNLLPHRFKVPLHPINANRQSIFQREAFRVFRQYGAVVSSKREVVTHEHAQSDRTCQPKPLVVRVANPDRKSASLETGFQVKDTEHLHRIARHGEFLADYTDVTVT